MSRYAVYLFIYVLLALTTALDGELSLRRLALVNYGIHPFRSESRPVRISNGVILGTSDGKSEVFMGIPYALPPIGSRRFMRPESIKDVRWLEPRSAKKTGPMCVQRSAFFAVTPVVGNEDCLHLNVYRPTSASFPESRLPVMVFIHGGAFTVGSGYWLDGQFDGSNLARDENVIVVVMNYRMNLFGFFASAELQDANGGSVGNVGLQDQQESLRWVKREIVNFGGDPDNITLFGESAGGFSVVWHSVNMHSIRENLFHKTIVQSATTDLSWFFQSRDDAFQLYSAFSKFLNCDTLICLQAIPSHDLLRGWTAWSETIFAANAVRSDHHPELIPLLHMLCAFGPVIDGHPDGLVALPRSLIKAGAFHRVPLMAGITRDEGSLFALIIPLIVGASEKTPMTVDQWIEILQLVLQRPAAVSEMHALYPLKKIEGLYAAQVWAMELIRDAVFGCSTEELVVDWSSDDTSVAWMYLFSATLGPVGKYTGMGAMHSFELHYIFKNFPPGFAWQKDFTVSEEMSARWAQFARSGTPNIPSCSVDWEPYKIGGQFIEFGAPEIADDTIVETLTNWAGWLFGNRETNTCSSTLVTRKGADKKLWPEEHKCDFWKRQIPLPWIPHKGFQKI